MITHRCEGSLKAHASIRYKTGYMFEEDNGWQLAKPALYDDMYYIYLDSFGAIRY